MLKVFSTMVLSPEGQHGGEDCLLGAARLDKGNFLIQKSKILISKLDVHFDCLEILFHYFNKDHNIVFIDFSFFRYIVEV